ncbi:mitochondrial carrier domain-containing protein [Lentinula guzmanii]|uniref:Mitochondrial carrier domain-containing protein n=1 Tax=Lentinula guzmanii TaxID=2804957 RepID=A0AA38MYS4_9AGAR|nr:mitochondrial carrier domain-containing protein [Lentinula guzmanii]
MTSAFPPLVQAISGAIGSASANTLTYPLDLVTTRVQLGGDSFALDSSKQLERSLPLKVVRILRSIVQSDGVGALYDGLVTDTASTLISNFFYFYIYSFLRKLLVKRLTRSQLNSTSLPRSISSKSLPSIKLAVWQDLALGFLSGVASRVVSMPLSIITLRLQIGRHDSEGHNSKREGHHNAVVQAVKEIYEEEGLSGFWRGFNTTILLSLNPSITLAFYQLFRRLLTITRRSPHTAVLDPTPLEAFFGGAVSSSVAVALLYPLILSKTRLQAAHKSSSSSESTHSTVSAPTLISIMLDAYEGRYNRDRTQKWDGNEGVTGFQGLYQGLEMQILKGFLNQGVTFLVKGRIEQLIIQTYMRHRLGNLSNLTLPSIPTPLDSGDPHRSLETWNIVEHVGRRYL